MFVRCAVCRCIYIYMLIFLYDYLYHMYYMYFVGILMHKCRQCLLFRKCIMGQSASSFALIFVIILFLSLLFHTTGPLKKTRRRKYILDIFGYFSTYHEHKVIYLSPFSFDSYSKRWQIISKRCRSISNK